MSFDDSRDTAHLRGFAARAQQSQSGGLRGPAIPGTTNQNTVGSIHHDSTKANNGIQVLPNQRKTQVGFLRESFQQSGGPRW